MSNSLESLSEESENIGEIDLNMSDFESGVYFVEVLTNKGHNKIKIIKN